MRLHFSLKKPAFSNLSGSQFPTLTHLCVICSLLLMMHIEKLLFAAVVTGIFFDYTQEVGA